jgi:hypothetical protein
MHIELNEQRGTRVEGIMNNGRHSATASPITAPPSVARRARPIMTEPPPVQLHLLQGQW